MSLSLDVRYAKLLNLDQIKETQKNYFNFRCPICGDSQKSKTKKRGWLIPTQDKQGLFFNCFNCSVSMGMPFFIYKVNRNLLRSYNQEKFKESHSNMPAETKVEPSQIIKIEVETVKNIETVIQLPNNHIAFQYLKKRHVDTDFWNEIYYTRNFKKWVNENYLPGKYEHTNFDDHRIVFPLYTMSNELVGFQGRSLDPDNQIRYLTIRIKESDQPLCYNLNKIKSNQFINIVEGPLDSLVLNNALAMLRSNIELEFIKRNFLPSYTVFIFDNEPRNKNIVRNYDKIANTEDFGLFIWPKNIDVKDLNELAVNKNMSRNEITDFVKEYTVFGQLKKRIQLANWKIT
jgi:hypothetical protein